VTIAALVMMTAVPLRAQQAAPAPADSPTTSTTTTTVDDLRAPTSPAFSLLGLTPSAVDRPQTTKALTVDLLSAVSSAEGIPKNYALEVTPYWFAEHPALTFNDYYDDRNYGSSLLRTFAISVATAPIDAGDATKGTQLALGMRAMIVPGHANAALEELRQRLLVLDKQAIAEMGEGLDALRRERARIAAKLKAATGTAARAGWQARLTAVDDKIEKRHAEIAQTTKATAQQIAERRATAKKLTARISDLDAQRDGFMLTVAEGQAWAFANDMTSAGQLTRASVWITPAYRIRPCDLAKDDESLECASTIDLIGVLRYTSDRTVPDDASRWDVGGRIAWQVNKQLALSAEAVQRSRPLSSTSTDPTHRTVGIVEYRVTDGTLFFASFGKDFDNGTDHKTLVTLMGLNFGLGQKPVIDLSK
jgi:hypothetical protein